MESARLTLRDGRVIELRELQQTRTYEGLLEGLPTTRKNEAHLRRMSEQSGPSPRHLIVPKETPIPLEPGETYPFGTPASLPSITCVARFRSRSTTDDPLNYSELIIVWLQDEFALPIDSDTEGQIRGLNWTALAKDFEY